MADSDSSDSDVSRKRNYSRYADEMAMEDDEQPSSRARVGDSDIADQIYQRVSVFSLAPVSALFLKGSCLRGLAGAAGS